jgi:hypothetical protein
LVAILRFEAPSDVLQDLFNFGYMEEEMQDMQTAKLGTDGYPAEFLGDGRSGERKGGPTK